MFRFSALGLAAAVVAASGCVSTSTRPARDLTAPARQTALQVGGLSCPLCAHNADLALRRLPGVLGSQVDLSTGWVTLSLDPATPPTDRQIEDAVLDAGFTVAVPAAPARVAGHDEAAQNPDDRIIKSQSVSVELAAPVPRDRADGVVAQLMKLPDVASVQVAEKGSRVDLVFKPQACLTQGQVRRAL